ADLVPTHAAGRFWGRRQSITTSASLVGLAVAGFLLDHFRTPGGTRTTPLGFALVFGLSAVCGVADILLQYGVKEPRRMPVPRETGLIQRLFAPLMNRDFRHLTLAMSAWNAAVVMFTPFSIVYLKRDFAISYSQISLLAIVGSLGTVVTSAFFGRLTDRLGARVLCAIILILAPFMTLPWFFVNTSSVTLHLPVIGLWEVPQVVLVQCFGTFLFSGLIAAITPCQLRLAAQLSQASGRTMAMAIHWSIIGVISSLGAIIGGWIMDWIGVHPLHWTLGNGTILTFFHVIIGVFSLILWGIAVPLILSIRTPVDRVSFGTAVARIRRVGS
ncbi:MAG: MFS transporter, partial [Negativicutes bacterium]|nr:MFS transporter [Negativicutes bacterium]